MPNHLLTAAAAAMLLASSPARAASLSPREEPAKSIPVPSTVSPAMQAVIAQPLRTNWDHPPTMPEAWTELVNTLESAAAPQVAPMAERLHVKIEPSTIAGVRVYTLTPNDIPAGNRNRLLVHVHGGCYVLNPRLAALPEALMLAGRGRMKVIAVDYRMPPEAYFPAALDDAVAVYKAAIGMVPPGNVGVFGSSAGGALTLEMMLRAKSENIPMTGAIAPGTPMSDVTKQGDTFQTNALVDTVTRCHAVFGSARRPSSVGWRAPETRGRPLAPGQRGGGGGGSNRQASSRSRVITVTRRRGTAPPSLPPTDRFAMAASSSMAA